MKVHYTLLNKGLHIAMSGSSIVDRACIGCGYCCITHPCAYGKQRHPEPWENHCPELEWTGERHICRMMNQSRGMGEMYRELLNVGLGCPSHQNAWRSHLRNRLGEKVNRNP